jgi:hypothetical protein
VAAIPNASSSQSRWYQTERNTEALVKAVLTVRPVAELSGEDIWCLIRFAWITAGSGDSHWQQLKVPAIAHLFKKPVNIGEDLASTIASMTLPPAIATAASKPTGMVNAYRAYRNSLLPWCNGNKAVLRTLLAAAQKLGSNDQARFDLASKIDALPPVPTPNGLRHMAGANLITPLIACLDPKLRFPIVNGEHGVKRRLDKLGLTNRSLADKVRGLIGLIGQFGIGDAFALDVMNDEQIDKITKRKPKAPKGAPVGSKGTALSHFDDAERKAVLMARTLLYRKRHNTMTNALGTLLPALTMTQGDRQECRFDVLISNYDAGGRDLLIEAKPDPDRGSLRIAIGQLLDYRRFLPHQAGTDLAVLTITPPPKEYIELLQDLQITVLWFGDTGCGALSGDGKAWKALKPRISSTVTKR